MPDLTYYIGSGPIVIQNGFGSDHAECVINYSLVEEGKTSFNTNIFSFNPAVGVIGINTSSLSLHLTEVTLIVKAISNLSGAQAQQIFTVTFLDNCRDITLLPAAFSDVYSTA